MTKTKTYAQLKAKKAWRLHKPSAKKARCQRRNQPRENKNMATDAEGRTSLMSAAGNDKVAEYTSLGGSSHQSEDYPPLAFAAKCSGGIEKNRRFHNSVVELLYNLMATGYQRLKGLGKTFYTTAEALLPGRAYKRKLDEVTERLDGLESEVKRLKLELTKVDHWHHHQLGQSQSIPAMTSDSNVFAPPPLPPPPPPPPPPPVAPPPPVFTGVKNRQKPSDKSKAPTVQKRAIVTVDDLLSVKLRSTRASSKSDVAECDNILHDELNIQTRAPLRQLPINQSASKKQPVISLKDIQNVSLRKLHLDIEAAKKLNSSSPESTALFTRRNLRRVNIDRSPGGTPMVTERRESTGTGLTPMMTRALKRKFQFANPPSSSPTSPCSSGKRKSLSPLVSPPLSPLSLR